MADKKTLNAREIISRLFDEESFFEIGEPSSSVITGAGSIDGATVYAFVQDIDKKSGAVDGKSTAKVKRLYDLAVKNGCPVAAFFNSKGGDIKEGAALLDSFGGIAAEMARLSGVVPLISAVVGQCSGISSVICRMADFVIMTEEAELFLTSPCGKADNALKTGACDIVVKNAEEAADTVKKLIRILPQNNLELAYSDYYELNDTEPEEDLKGASLAEAVADTGSLIEIRAGYGKSAYVALGSLSHRSVGIVAAGGDDEKCTLTSEDCVKIADFVNTCDAFSIPVVTIVDFEGFDAAAESVRDAAKLTQVYASASVPKISLVTGNATGAAFIALGSLRSGTDFLLAYKNAVISPVSPKAAAVLLNSDRISGGSADGITREYIAEEVSAEVLLEKGCIDAVTEPSQVRKALISALEMTASKRVSAPNRKHINIKF